MAKLNNIQALIVHSYQEYGHRTSRHLMFAVSEAAEARKFLAAWLPRLAHAAASLTGGPNAVANLSLTYSGLTALGALPPGAATAFPGEFVAGPEPSITGDVGASSPDSWWNRKFRTEDVHVVLHVHARSEAALEATTRDVRVSAATAGMRELLPARGDAALTGTSLAPNPRELHFGYCDGFSQPEVDWEDQHDQPDSIDLRHVLLGYANDAIPSQPRQQPWEDIVRDGSYLFLRWLYQDVAAFEQYLTNNAALVSHLPAPQAREFLAAKMMGRWRDGTPLVLSPEQPDPAKAGHPFTYANDQDGQSCPFSAHIRIANRRDDPLGPPNDVMFGAGQPRVIRRGMTYGPRLEGDVDDGVDRGIIGLFFCASINRQIYPMLRWMRRTNFREVFEQAGVVRRQDPIVGNRREPLVDRSFTIPTATGETVLRELPAFVQTRGTVFLLTPGLPALARMAGAGGG